MKMTYIYSLNCPLTGEVKYIGKSDNPQKRLNQHISESKSKRSRKDKWINSLLSRNLTPILEILEQIPQNKWKSTERKWIRNMKQSGVHLLNIAPGGVYIPKRKRKKRNK